MAQPIPRGSVNPQPRQPTREVLTPELLRQLLPRARSGVLHEQEIKRRFGPGPARRRLLNSMPRTRDLDAAEAFHYRLGLRKAALREEFALVRQLGNGDRYEFSIVQVNEFIAFCLAEIEDAEQALLNGLARRTGVRVAAE